MKRLNVTAALLALALVACQQSDPNNIAIDEGNNSPAADDEVVPPSEDAAQPATDRGGNALNEADDAGAGSFSPPGTPETSMIPGQYRGRWGQVAADCERGRSDAKGLITIGEKSIRFYEATATLKEQRPAIATSFSGLFGFTGEGQTWQKVMTFTRTGSTLKRADKEGSFSYKRCT